MNAVTALIPAFDPDSPDAQILDGYERVRAARAYLYTFDGSPETVYAERQAEFDELDAKMVGDEDAVDENVANTIPGVIARLLLTVPRIDVNRWVDSGLMEHGLLALYREVKGLDRHAQTLVYAAHELVEIEWQQNLAAYEKMAADFEIVSKVRDLVDAEQGRRDAASEAHCDFLKNACGLADDLQTRFLDDGPLRRLVRTLVPDHDAYLRKVNIILTEGVAADATPWLARDTNYLIGRIERDEPAKEAR